MAKVVVQSERDGVPPAIRAMAAWSWRIGLICGLIYGIHRFLNFFAPIAFPFFLAILLTALLAPLVNSQVRFRVPKALAVAVTLLLALATITGLMTLVGTGIADDFDDLVQQTQNGLGRLTEMLGGTSAGSWANVESTLMNVYESMGTSSQDLAKAALSVTGTAGQIATGFLLTFFCSVFLLYDGRGMWCWFLRFIPKDSRAVTDKAATAGWQTMTSFVRATVVVALVDAVGIGLGAYLLGVPLVLPIMVLVFLGAFVPMLGAIVTGGVAVLVAFVGAGPLEAVLMLVVVIVVQQLESHVLQPFLLGRAVAIHPIAVVMSIGAGLMVGGIMGALVAVPVIAVANAVLEVLRTEAEAREASAAEEAAADLADTADQTEAESQDVTADSGRDVPVSAEPAGGERSGSQHDGG